MKERRSLPGLAFWVELPLKAAGAWRHFPAGSKSFLISAHPRERIQGREPAGALVLWIPACADERTCWRQIFSLGRVETLVGAVEARRRLA